MTESETARQERLVVAPKIGVTIHRRSAATIFSRKEMLRGASLWPKPLFGAALVLVGAFILFEIDKRIETAILDLSPEWLIRLTTAF